MGLQKYSLLLQSGKNLFSLPVCCPQWFDVCSLHVNSKFSQIFLFVIFPEGIVPEGSCNFAAVILILWRDILEKKQKKNNLIEL